MADLQGRGNADSNIQDVPYRATVLEPVGKFASYFPTVNSAIDKRNHKVSYCFLLESLYEKLI